MLNWLKNRKKLLVVTHVSPDGDAIGSVSGFTWIAERLGLEVIPFVEEIPDFYAPFAHPAIVEDGQVDMEDVDGIVCLDCANTPRLHVPFGDWEKRPNLPVLNIDHHASNEKYGNENILNVEASSTCEMVAMAAYGNSIVQEEAATALYMGLLTDTGGFRFANTDANAYDTASYLMDKGANHEAVIESLYFSKTEGHVAFEANMMSNAVYHYDKQLVFALIKASDFAKFDVKPSMVEETTQRLREIGSVRVAVRLIEAGEGIRIALRSKDSEIDVSKVAQKFGGGGHKMASGAFIDGASLEGAMEQIASVFGGILG